MTGYFDTSLDRGEALTEELAAEYDRCLTAQQVSSLAIELTHEVFEKYRGVLDRLARRYWDTHVSPALPAASREKASVYFPISKDTQAFRSTMGRWRIGESGNPHSDVLTYLEAKQPFTSAENAWLMTLNQVAIAGKHVNLIAQGRTEEQRTTVSGGGMSVSWGSGATFGPGVRVIGAPIDPATQRIVPTPGVEERIETWVSFIIEGHNVNALGFCRDLDGKCRAIVNEMAQQFSL